jgi:hypothetical protein
MAHLLALTPRAEEAVEEGAADAINRFGSP